MWAYKSPVWDRHGDILWKLKKCLFGAIVSITTNFTRNNHFRKFLQYRQQQRTEGCTCLLTPPLRFAGDATPAAILEQIGSPIALKMALKMAHQPKRDTGQAQTLLSVRLRLLYAERFCLKSSTDAVGNLSRIEVLNATIKKKIRVLP